MNPQHKKIAEAIKKNIDCCRHGNHEEKSAITQIARLHILAKDIAQILEEEDKKIVRTFDYRHERRDIPPFNRTQFLKTATGAQE